MSDGIVGVDLERGEEMRSKNDVEMGSMGSLRSSEEEESLLDGEGRSRTVSPTLHGEKEEKSPSPSVPAVIITPSRNREEKHSDCSQPRPPGTPRLARLASPDPDIQLADPPPLSASPSSSTLQSVCGPKPGKIAVICLVVVSIWASWVLVIHLNKKMDLLNEAVLESSHKIKSMDDATALFRSKSAKRMHRLQEELEQVVASLAKGNLPPARSVPSISTAAPTLGSKRSPVLPSFPPTQSVPFASNNQNNKNLQTELPTTAQPVDRGACTESGDSCVFPFTFKGEIHEKCVQAWTDIKPWCATGTGPKGQFLEDSWSYCQKCS